MRCGEQMRFSSWRSGKAKMQLIGNYEFCWNFGVTDQAHSSFAAISPG